MGIGTIAAARPGLDFLVARRADAVGLAMLRNISVAEAPAGRAEAAMHRRVRTGRPSLGNELGNGREKMRHERGARCVPRHVARRPRPDFPKFMFLFGKFSLGGRGKCRYIH